ncbi:MAG TPA: polysaccharide biosynthesis/export family protein [Caulobacteraceae bacterium]|nr:polysaccharide biosynthesis/export family protein [Caulobacteraceae bacterium]
MVSRINAMIVAGVLALAGLGSQASAADGTMMASLPPPDVIMGGEVREYTIAPQDTLTISVFQVADLNRDVEVDAAGQIRLPLIGTMSVAGKPARVVAEDISAKLRDGYVLSPDVNVTVKGSPGQRVTVEGAVVEPGVYPLVGRTTLLQVIAQAKGPEKIADEKKVAVFRTVQNRRAAALFDLTAIREGRADDPVIYGNDVVVVEQSGSKRLMETLRGAMPLIGIFRWF